MKRVPDITPGYIKIKIPLIGGICLVQEEKELLVATMQYQSHRRGQALADAAFIVMLWNNARDKEAANEG